MTYNDFHLALGLWTTPPSKLLKKAAKEGGVGVVDSSGIPKAILSALGERPGVTVKVADVAVSQAQLTLRCAPQPDAPFPFEDVAEVLVAAAGKARAAAAEPVLVCRDAVLPLLGGPEALVLPPSGLLLVASGAKADVMRWYGEALRALRVPGVAFMTRPGYRPSNAGRSALLSRGRLTPALRDALERAFGLSYVASATLVPLAMVPPDEALREAC